LEQVVSIPTASFFEHRVSSYIQSFLEEIGVPYRQDRWGNIIAHYQKGQNIHPLALMAHTDHPALEIITESLPTEHPTATHTAKLLGGVLPACFEKEVGVRVYNRDVAIAMRSAKVVGYSVGDNPRSVTLYLKVEGEGVLAGGSFGVWDLTDFALKDNLIHARAIDDLAGCAAMLLTFWRLAQEKAEANVYGLFTRAEEVGLVGADMLFQSRLLPQETLVVSIEASKALPGAVQGEGPVIRAGDRAFVFNDEAEFIMKQAAAKLGGDVVGRDPQTTKIQRQLMTGGRCEAGSAILNGYRATGMAFPLGNYHNVPDDRTQPGLTAENIHQQDFISGVALLQQVALLMPQLPVLRAEFEAKETVNEALAQRLLDTNG
jgi:endoglucanase